MPAKSKPSAPRLNMKNVEINNFAVPVVAIVVSVLLFIFLIIPKTSDYFKTKGNIDETQKETDQLTTLANSLEQINVTDYQNDLTTTEKVLPTDIDAPASINQIQAALAQNNLQLTSLSFSNSGSDTTQVSGPSSSFTVAMGTQGDLTSIKQFINQIEAAPQVMRLNDLSVSSAKNGGDEVTMSLSVYYQQMAKPPASFNTPVEDLSSQDKTELSKIEDRANQPNLAATPPQGTTGKPNPFQ